MRLYCVPPAGAGPAYYVPWVPHLPGTIGLYAVQLPGRGSQADQLCPTDPVEVTRAIAGLVHHDVGTHSFALFGHSIGALLAYETARVLRRVHHRSPLLLAVSALPPPHLDQVAALPLLLDDARDVLAQVLSTMTETDARHRCTAVRRTATALLADMVLGLQYRHHDEAPLDIPVTVYGGRDDPIADKEQLGAWGDLCTEPVAPHLFPGDHMYPVEQAPALTARLARDLRAAHRYSAP